VNLLVIQSAFIGDVILATSVLEALHARFPDAAIDFLVRKGNEGLVEGHPFIRTLHVWDKKGGKYRELVRLVRTLRAARYDHVVNLQRHFTTALLTVLSGAGETAGFAQNLLSRLFTRRLPHVMSGSAVGVHEVDRDLSLVAHLTGSTVRVKPRLYPRPKDFERTRIDEPYVTISPTSVWFTKQLPGERWVEVIDRIDPATRVFLLGGPADAPACERIRAQARHPRVEVMAGRLSFLESAALMQRAAMNYVNDSAPLHMASATDAPVTAVFCSTLPAFGFGPLSARARILEVQGLSCRPCGLHGRRRCPEGHFACADIAAERIVGLSP
jgi:heptosyltransferase-2